MSLRRFVNLVLLHRKREMYSLHHIDLSRLDLFYTATPPTPKPEQEMERIQIPPACLNFQPKPCSEDGSWKMNSFGVTENKIICSDNFGVSFLYNASVPCISTMPTLHSPKNSPISLSVFDPEDDGAGSVYIMEQVPMPRPEKGQFEAFVYAMPEMYYEKSWYRHSLPVPPFVLHPGYMPTQISSYAVLGGGSHLCISAMGVGTYCFDTTSREWSRAGDWMLPIIGKAEYVPELNLWFGLSVPDGLPCTADLSSVLNGDKPEVCKKWETNHFPHAWNSFGSSEIISLGSARFFTVDYFLTELHNTYPTPDKLFAVFSGVELKDGKPGTSIGGTACGSCSGNDDGIDNGNGERGLQLIYHKSKIYMSDGSSMIDEVL